MSTTSRKHTTLLIDGDVVVYRCTAAAQTSVEFVPGEITATGDVVQAKQRVDGEIAGLLKTLDADDAIVCLSDDRNWRKELCPTYKQGRGPKPLGYAEVLAYTRATFKCMTWPRLEADDVLGILSTGKQIKGRRIIVSVDKDLLSVPGLLYNPGHPERGVITVTKAQADDAHLMQTLTGDSTDGYPGLPGCGPKKARALLDKCKPKERWPAIVEAFKKKELSEEAAYLQAHLARILRVGEYDDTNNTIRLWRAA